MRKKLSIAAIVTGVLLLTACAAGNGQSQSAGNARGSGGQEEAQSGEQNEASSESSEEMQGKMPGEEAELKGELTILSWFPNAEFTWEAVIEAFTKEHPGVTITVDCPKEQEMYFENYATKIMSGEGYDIVQEADFASSQKGWDELGLFADLYEFMESDENFHKEDYFSCIYEPMETDGKLYSFLRNAAPVYIRMNKRLLEQAGVEYDKETINFDELYEIYEKVREKCGEKIYLTEDAYYDPLSAYEENYYIQNNLLDTDEYEEYLRKNHAMCYETEKRNVYSEFGQGIAGDVLCRVLGINLQSADLVNDIFNGTEDFTPAISYVSMHGERYLASTNSLSISSFSENKALAWEFLKFVVGNYNVDYRDAGFLPPNKERTTAKCEGVEPEIREKLFQDIEAINAACSVNINLSRNLEVILEDYYINNTLTAKECRKQMADRVYLYMNE